MLCLPMDLACTAPSACVIDLTCVYKRAADTFHWNIDYICSNLSTTNYHFYYCIVLSLFYVVNVNQIKCIVTKLETKLTKLSTFIYMVLTQLMGRDASSLKALC